MVRQALAYGIEPLFDALHVLEQSFVGPDQTRLVVIVEILISQDGDLVALGEQRPLLIGVSDGSRGEAEELVPDRIEYGGVEEIAMTQGIECARSNLEKSPASTLEPGHRLLNQ
jgi:hypothetical protein